MKCLPHAFLMRRIVALLLSVFAFVSAFGLSETLRVSGGFTESQGILTASGGGEPKLITTASLAPGYYCFSAEYRTIGFDPQGGFVVDVKKMDRGIILANAERIGATSDWTPMSIFFRVGESGIAQIRMANWQNVKNGFQLQLRKTTVSPFSFGMKPGVNWLQQEEFDRGQVGSAPPNWYCHNLSGGTSQGVLVSNTSFRTGRHILRLVGTTEKMIEMRHRSLPLPDSGEVVFSLWARADQPVPLTMHIIQDGWAKRVEKTFTLTTAWQKYEVTWPVPTPREKDWFFLRLDGPKGTVPIEIADIRLETKASAAVEAVDSHEAGLAHGWQGVPGANLLYNPDFELGGTGYFYDFSWPKQYSDYARIRLSRPVELLSGKGIDGGTCALVQGSTLRPYCFPVTVGKTYTLSADLRAPDGMDGAACRVSAYDSEWKCALLATADNLSASTWKRHHWTFTWKADNIQKRGYVRFDSSGVLIDRIQVVEGSAVDYEAPPVMLGLVYNRWPYFVRGRDVAQASIKVVPGAVNLGTASVEITASDVWGRGVWKQTLQAPLNRTTTIPVDLSTNCLGVFHLDMKATVGGKVVGIGIGRYAVLDPAYIQPPSSGHPGLAGICQESFNFPVWLCQDHATIQTDLGVRFNRFFASVPPDLPSPIPAEFAEDLRAKCRPFRQAGIEVMPCVNILPESAAQNAQNLAPPRTEDLEKYGQHLRAYVDALRKEVTYWEIFNEPNLWRVPRGPDSGKRTMYPLKYLEFQKVAYRVIKQLDPKLQVVAPGLNNVDFEWLSEWMKAGAGAYMDVFSFHPYSETDFVPQGVQLESQMSRLGFKGPLLNSEKYFGANLFYDRAGYEETRRAYYLPHEGELKTAGRSIQHFVSSASLGIPVCFFNPEGTICRRGPATELFLYDFFGAYNAAIRFVAPAGRGERISLGQAATAIVFPNSPDGPLVALWSSQLNLEGSLCMTGDFSVYDIMGNLIPPEKRKQGIRLATDPSYVRFKAGTSLETIRAALLSADLFGMGDPFKVSLSIGGGRKLTAWVQSQRNKPLDGRISVVKVPEGWSAPQAKTFTNLQPAKAMRMDFDLGNADFKSMAEYPISVVAESGEEFVRTDDVLRPLFAKAAGNIVVDGKLEDWAGAEWVELGESNLSKNFDANLKHRGGLDLSAKLAVAWSRQALAVAVVVTDDRHCPAEAPALAWQGDSVQVYLDPLNDATPESPNRQDDVEYLCSLIGGESYAWLAKGMEGNYRGDANKVEGFRDVEASCKIVRSGTTTIYELLLPRKPCLPSVEFTPDAAWGFSILINDNDGAGRKVGLTLSPAGTEPYGAPHLQRDLILVEK